MNNITQQQLIDFEQDIAKEFQNKTIRAPIHLNSGSEDQLIKIFNDYHIDEKDWVCCTWRSHYECLLKGVPPELLKERILQRKSISLCFKDYNIISSGIVGGICPIALGVALALKKQNKGEYQPFSRASFGKRVFCFVGDMSAETGIFHECWKYSIYNNLPILWIIADNGKSVCTDTKKSWGFADGFDNYYKYATGIHYLKYELGYPHSGGLTRVNF